MVLVELALQLLGDGRLMALGSYENRVYLAHLEPGTPLADAHAAVVLKFNRPGRWSAAQIEEEHAFAHELMAAEVPVVGPLRIDGRTLHDHGGFLFSVSPRRGGRLPEPGDMETLEWIGRFLARLHTVGARQPFAQRPAVDLASYGVEPRDWLLAQDVIPLELRTAWQQACDQALELIAVRACQQRAGGEKDPQNSPIQHLRADAVVVACGSNRICTQKLAQLTGSKIGRADADFVRERSGFAIGGVSPVGHRQAPSALLIDEELLTLGDVYAAAGSPFAIFRTTGAELAAATGGQVANIKEDAA